MNVTLPEREKGLKKRVIIYTAILTVCVISIGIAIYQFFADEKLEVILGITETEDEEIDELKSEFNRIIDSWISTNAIEWLTEHFIDVEDDDPELAKAKKAVDDFYNNCRESNPMACLLAED